MEAAGVEGRLTALEFRMKQAEEFRREYRPKVDDLVNNTAVERAVKSALGKHRGTLFTRFDKLVAATVGTCAIASFVMQAFH